MEGKNRACLAVIAATRDAEGNLALALLGKGDYEHGLREYEWRWQTKEMPPRKFTQPAWDGGPPGGKTILLYAEQGLGDTIQLIRYARLVTERGGKVVVECQKALVPLLALRGHLPLGAARRAAAGVRHASL